jgi:hypothetical protein
VVFEVEVGIVAARRQCGREVALKIGFGKAVAIEEIIAGLHIHWMR